MGTKGLGMSTLAPQSRILANTSEGVTEAAHVDSNGSDKARADIRPLLNPHSSTPASYRPTESHVMAY